MKGIVRHTAVIIAAAATVGAACGSPPAPKPPAVHVEPGAAQPDTVAAPVPGQNPSTNRIACGSHTCNASTEVCCSFSDDYGCAPRVWTVPGDSAEDRLAPLIDSCKRAVHSEYSFDFVGMCDDSTDCPAGQVCCSQWLWSGAGTFECKNASPDGASACDFHEPCVDGSCATRGTTCVNGECRKAGAKVRCAGVVCGDDAPICCLRDFNGTPKCERDCRAADPESRAVDYECSSSAGCPAGATCQAGMFGSFCASLVDTANAVTLCESDSDCPPDGCAWLGKKTPPVCREGHSLGFTHCDCD